MVREPPPRCVSFRTSDLDEARSINSDLFYPHTLRLLQPAARMTARFRVFQFGWLTLADGQWGAAIAGTIGDLNAYHLDLQLRGHLVARQHGEVIRGDVGRAAAFAPVGETVIDRMSADSRTLGLKIDPYALEAHLESLLDTSIRVPLRLAGGVDVTDGPGRAWADLVRLFAAELTNRHGLVYQPIVAEPLRESLLTALLLAVGHPYRDALHQPAPGCPRHTVGRAVEAIHADPRSPHTTATLARLAGISPRRLQAGFRREVGMSPMAYLRHIRIGRAHTELLDLDPGFDPGPGPYPGRSAVVEVARRWGFTSPGRFAAAYQARYHVSPAQTLRSR